ncbi:hypothetical protein ES706_02400 [subsurface metagenome]
MVVLDKRERVEKAFGGTVHRSCLDCRRGDLGRKGNPSLVWCDFNEIWMTEELAKDVVCSGFIKRGEVG